MPKRNGSGGCILRRVKNGDGKWQFNDGHLHNRAIRKSRQDFPTAPLVEMA